LSSLCSPGANSPIDWIEENVVSLVPELSPEREKILLGLNFYGYDFTSSTMDGKKIWDTYTYMYMCTCAYTASTITFLLIEQEKVRGWGCQLTF
jgi:hypothetical protein